MKTTDMPIDELVDLLSKMPSDPLNQAATTITTLQGEVESLRDERDNHIMQLSGISTASIQNTKSTIKDRITKENPYWTVAYGDVCVAIDREIRERTRAEESELLAKYKDETATTFMNQVKKCHTALQKAKGALETRGNDVLCFDALAAIKEAGVE